MALRKRIGMPVEIMDELPGEKTEAKPKAKAKKKAVEKPRVEAQDKPSCYWDGPTLVIRASALGYCLGNLVRQGLGQTQEPPPDFMQAKFDEGHESEPIIVDWVRSTTWGVFDDWELEDRFGELHDGQARIEIPVGTTCVIRQHFDGFVRDNDEARTEYCLEAKAWSKGTHEKFVKSVTFEANDDGDELSIINPESLRSSYIAWQVSEAIVGSGMPMLLVIGEKVERRGEDGKIDKEYDGPLEIEDFHTYVILEPPFSRAKVLARAMKIEALVNDGKPPPCDVRQFPCGFWQEHDEDEGVWAKGVAVQIGSTNVEEAMFDTFASNYAAGHTMEKQGKELKKKASEGLAIAFEGVEKGQPVESETLVVQKVEQNPKGGIDWEKAAREAGVDDKAAEKYRKPDGYRSWYTVELKED